MSIPINKDLEKEYRNEFFKGFTLKEIGHVALGLAVMGAVTALVWSRTGLSPAICIYIGLPFGIVPMYFGFKTFQGMSARKYLQELWYERKTAQLLYQACEMPKERRVFSMESGAAGSRTSGKRNSKGAGSPKFKRRLFLLAALAAALILLLVVRESRSQEGRKEYESLKQEQEAEAGKPGDTDGTETKKPDKTGDKTDGEDTGRGSEDEPKADGEVPEKGTVKIANLDVYATAIMGSDAGLLEEQLSAYAASAGIRSAGGNIIHVAVPEDEPDSVAFFVRMDDGTIATLTWHPSDRTVTAAACSYTEEEIREEVWQGGGPAERDIPEEEDAAFRQQESGGTEETGGEQP